MHESVPLTEDILQSSLNTLLQTDGDDQNLMNISIFSH